MSSNTDIHVSWTIDCEATQRAISDADLGQRSIRGFVDVLRQRDFKMTLFVLPGDAVAFPNLLKELQREGCEVGLHLHPHEEGWDDHCGAFGYTQQLKLYGDAIRKFSDAVGFAPTSIRNGSFSANDSTFPVCAELGFSTTSHSCPGRRMNSLCSNWVDAPQQVHFAHPHNRLLEGGLNLVEVPASTDPDSMLWSGKHPQDLRVELFDAKNQAFLIDKLLARESTRQAPVRSIVALTHNVFDFSDPANFYRQTLVRMADDFKRLADKHAVRLIPATISGTAKDFRSRAKGAA